MIIAREVSPYHVDFSAYFDDDGLKSVSGENHACYIVPLNRNRNSGFNMDEYEGIERLAENLFDFFEDIRENRPGAYYSTYKEAMESIGIPYTSRKCHSLKEWTETACINHTDSIAEFLTITTGEEWDVRSFRGYSQGDYCEVVYCNSKYTKDHITEIGKLWLGCGTEFIIDDCRGYFVIDEIRWKEDGLRNHLAEMYGCKPEELEVYLYAGEHTVTDYKLLERVV